MVIRMQTPIANILGRKDFVEMAELQDDMVEALYSLDPNIILHGGTAIWRCYSGNRFSYDIDAYVTSKHELDIMAEGLGFAVRKRGGQLDRLRIIKRTIMGSVSNGRAEARLDILYQKKPVHTARKVYLRADGTFLNVLTLSAEDFIMEKMDAYRERKYIRDLYDVYHIINYVDDLARIRAALLDFLKEIEKSEDKNDLEGIVYAGAAPTFDEMVDYIRGRVE